MTAVTTMPSNSTGLSYAVEDSPGSVNTSPGPTWYPLEPNSYDDFGGEVTLLARNPINDSRQRKKGVVVDLAAAGGFETDITQTNLQDLIQGFLFSAMRTKTELASTAVVASPDQYTVASGGTGFKSGDLLWAKNFTTTGNNGLKSVTASGSTSVTVSESLSAESGQAGTISRVGFQFGSGGITVDASGALPKLVRAGSPLKDLTELGLAAGDWIWIGGDSAGTQFANASNNCWARVRTVSASEIQLDKTSKDMVTDTGSGKTIRIFMGRLCKNELGTSIVRRTYQLERTLGAPDTASPTDIQAEYITGCVPEELEIVVNTADKVMANMSFMGRTNELRTSAQGKKPGTRPSITESDALNTSSDVVRVALSRVSATDANPDKLFTYITEASIKINNNLSDNKAVGVLGSVDITEGTLEVSAEITAYFADVSAMQAIKDNADLTFDMVIVKNNAGIVLDMPLIALGDGRPEVEQDSPITIPLDLQAAAGGKISSYMNYTVGMVFFDYLPDLAA